MGGSQIQNWAFIIGSMKSGTTSLFEYLSRHPAVCPCRIKEPNFFSDDERWDLGLEWYRNLYDWDPAAHEWALEASTAYTKYPRVSNPAERMASIPGQKRLIFLMRDPIERIRSQIGYGRAKGWSTFTETRTRVPTKAIELSKYARQLEPYRREMGTRRLKLLHFEDLIESTRHVVEDVWEFLHLDEDVVTGDLEEAYNVTSEMLVPPDWYEEIRDVWLVRWVESLPFSTREIGSLLPGFETADRYELGPEQRKYILEELRDDLSDLESEYGVDLSRWGYDA